MRIGLIEATEGMEPGDATWDRLAEAIRSAAPDVLVTNEMPFGPWLAETGRYDSRAAQRSVALHEAGLAAWRDLQVPIVLSSRPVHAGGRLANEAFVLAGGAYRAAHHKHYFPEEPGFYETAWFRPERRGFDRAEAGTLGVGILLCTELYFNEWARHYRRQGVELIAAPRASGAALERWRTAAAMAAIVSGSYVVSSNRVGRAQGGQVFGGKGFAFTPDGTLLAETSSEQPVAVFELDRSWVTRQRDAYPCYVSELSADPGAG